MVTDRLRVLSVLPLLGHPRDSKRIAMLQEAGFQVEAVAFERDYHAGRLPHCPVERLGRIEHSRYARRVFRIATALPTMRKAIRRNEVVYASGPDMALMALVAGVGLRRPVVLEVGDIRELQVARGLTGWLVRMVDTRLTNACSLLVATAPRFIDSYYRQWLHTSVPAMVIENKLEASFANKTVSEETTVPPRKGRPLVDRPLRLGYFGGLRCDWSWRVLKALAMAKPNDIEIVLAGHVMEPRGLPLEIERYDNISYLGEYRSPKDLPMLYAQVDLSWACYHPIGQDDWNLRWARTNRFYEACFFRKPLISRAGSSDAIEVARFGIGLIIDDEKVDGAVNALSAIGSADLSRWQVNIAEVPRHVYVYTSEAEELEHAIKRIAGARFGRS